MVTEPDPRQREITALLERAATPAGRSAQLLLTSLDPHPPDLADSDERIQWSPAVEWLLQI